MRANHRLMASCFVLAACAMPWVSVRASCVSDHWLTAPGAAVVSNPAWGGLGGDGSCAYDGCYDVAPIGPALQGVFWALTEGDPAIGAGIDNGARPALFEWVTRDVYVYGSSVYYYPSFLADPGWTSFTATPTDGCVLDAGATPGNDGTECMALLLGDAVNDVGSFAVVTAQLDATTGLLDSPLSAIRHLILQPLPPPIHDGAFEPPLLEEHACNRIRVDPPPVPAAASILDPTCDDPLTGYRIYGQCKPRGAQPPVDRTRDDGNPSIGWQPLSAPLPLDTGAIVGLDCVPFGSPGDLYLAVRNPTGRRRRPPISRCRPAGTPPRVWTGPAA